MMPLSAQQPRVRGAVLSTADLDGSVRFFTDGFGLVTLSREQLDQRACEDLFGVQARTAQIAELETVGTGSGVTLVRFDPVAPDTIRDDTSRTATGAWKVIDFICADLEGALAHLDRLGVETGVPATYPMPEGPPVSEVHLPGPDGTTIALIHIHDRELAFRYGRVLDRPIGEIMSISGPVADLDTADRFYHALGLDQVYGYEVTSAEFGEMIGAGEAIRLQGRNYGPASEELTIGMIHYGVEGLASITHRGRFPTRGLVAVRIDVPSIEGAMTAPGAIPVTGVSERAGMPSLLMRPPHGPLHLLTERRPDQERG